MTIGRRRCCCAQNEPCHCAGTTFEDFVLEIAGFTDAAMAGLAAIINGTHVIPKTFISEASCSGGYQSAQELLYPTSPITVGCPDCEATTTTSSWLGVEAKIRPKGVYGPGGIFALTGLILEANVSLLGILSTCYGTPSGYHYSEQWRWRKEIPVTNCLDIDETLDLSFVQTLPDYVPHCAEGNVDGSGATLRYYLTA
ncbi:MAG TPA: hypothetical protein PLI18_19555 [Pirellulaceae bacterium]|nr:hypothetical protein [Pirellulaceae bacterium]